MLRILHAHYHDTIKLIDALINTTTDYIIVLLLLADWT